MADLNFDATQVDPDSPHEVIPAGWYRVMAIESEMKPTRNGDGQYLQITFQILDGQYTGRHLWERLNLINPSATAVEIAHKSLSGICHAVGVLQPKQSEELHNKPLECKVKVRPAKGDYDASNEISGYRKAGAVTDAPAVNSAPAPAPAQQPAAAAAGAPPWASK